MKPPPELVADTVRRLVGSRWPTAADRAAWFAEHDITPNEPLGAFSSWGTGIEGWGDAATCWSVVGDDVVGVGWFLWPFDPRAAQAAARLNEQLTAAFGEPRQRSDGDMGWLEWEQDETVVEFSAGTEEDPRVQLHVVDARHVVEGTLGECATEDGPGSC
ncbi:MAG TPA: hypothetical protein GXZ45_05825 [Propionibacterium sp.]|nr:hypothetical protein [Propionibacterium sp.]